MVGLLPLKESMNVRIVPPQQMTENNKILVYPSGKVVWQGKEFKVALGKSGVAFDKKEGDGATPAGCFPIREIFYRSDRISKPESVFLTRELSSNDGWCDDQKDQNYNKHIKLPYPASHESLWREDNLYDVIVVLGYNDNPPTPGKGSAIFMHVARENYSPTASCIALNLNDLLEILKTVSKDTLVCVTEDK